MMSLLTLTLYKRVKVRLDNRLRERRREKARGSRLSSNSCSSPGDLTKSGTNAFSYAQTSSPSTDEEPMQVGRARLSPTERQRRLNAGECLYCGKSGHFITSCPIRPKDLAHQ